MSRQESAEIKFPFNFEEPKKRHPLRGLVISILGWVLSYYAWWGLVMLLVLAGNMLLTIPFLYFFEPGGIPDSLTYPLLITFVLALPSLVIPFFGSELIETGRRMRAQNAISVLSEDRRAPVLYLRSFDDDDLQDPTLPSLFSVLFFALRPPFVRHRYEASLTKALSQIGPVICIGKPGESLPEIGAARIYVSNGEWQKAVEYFLSEAQAVVFTIGHTEALWWEVETVFNNYSLQRILLFVPYAEKAVSPRSLVQRYWSFASPAVLGRKSVERMNDGRLERYKAFREQFSLLRLKGLPEKIGSSLFLDFHGDGSVRLLRTRRPIDKAVIWSFFQASWTQVNFRRTLRPFFKKIEAEPPIEVE